MSVHRSPAGCRAARMLLLQTYSHASNLANPGTSVFSSLLKVIFLQRRRYCQRAPSDTDTARHGHTRGPWCIRGTSICNQVRLRVVHQNWLMTLSSVDGCQLYTIRETHGPPGRPYARHHPLFPGLGAFQLIPRYGVVVVVVVIRRFSIEEPPRMSRWRENTESANLG